MVLTKNRKPTLSPKTIFHVRVVSHKTLLNFWLKHDLFVMITIHKPIFRLQALPFLFPMKVCFYIFIKFKLTKNYFSEDQAKTPDSILPNWIVQVHKEDQFKNVFFNSCQFNLKQFLAKTSFLDWYKNKLDSSSWKDFNLHINELADVCVNQLETYFSNKQKPKQTRLMHSTERHHLSVTVTIHFPSLVSKYAEFQLQFKQKLLDCSQIKTSPNRSHFMVMFL